MRNVEGRILKLRKTGMSALRIADEVRRSIPFVTRILKDNGLETKNLRRIDWPVEQMRKWYEEDRMTIEQIGEKLGRSGKLVNKVAKKHGFRLRRRGPKSGPEHTGWKGGRRTDKSGYILVYCPDHPHASSKGDVREHRLVVEKKIGRYLKPEEVVHHKDDNPANNHIDNLQLFSSNGDHLAATLKGKCPKWSEDGKRRISEGVRLAIASRKKSRNDGSKCK